MEEFDEQIIFDELKEHYVESMNKEIADYIKSLRCSEVGHSWRSVATEVAEKYPDLNVIDGNQIDGKFLCEVAMAFLKEDIRAGW